MLEQLTTAISQQFLAAMAMFKDCLEKCPEEHWDDPVAKYPFWLVAYHTLYCTDGYLEHHEDAFKPNPTFHPGGLTDLTDEYPSKRFTKDELLAYTAFCIDKLNAALARQTLETWWADSGFKRRNMSRAELFIYNLRHVEHHTGQLSAVLRRAGLEPKWVSRGL